MASANAHLPYPHIVRDERIAGGQPIVETTRLPVATLVRQHQLGLELDEILAQYPSLSPAGLHAAFTYYFDHRDEIEAWIADAEQPPAGFELVDG
ncbi:MAG: DUF433 domain-containing protein [Myxococcales bacterium]|nr:DUF433 domain-containing protein [Myxococcales bacterium]